MAREHLKEKFRTTLLSQCPDCMMVLMTMEKGTPRYQHSVVLFEQLKKEPCYGCTLKKQPPLPAGEIPL